MSDILRLSLVAAALAATALLGTTASADSFNGAPDHQTGDYGYYYTVGGGLPQNGQTRNGDNASGGTIRFLADDPHWGHPLDAWQKDDWYPSTSSLALTMKNGAAIVYDNNGIESNTVPTGYWDNRITDTSNAAYGSGVVGYSNSNNFDFTYAGYFHLNGSTTFDNITGYFLVSSDPSSPAVGFDPNNPNIQFHSNIFSEVALQLPKNTGSFAGDVFTSNNTPGAFSWSDTGYIRYGGGGSISNIYRLNYALATPITLNAGDYYFSTDASVAPLPAPMMLGVTLFGSLAVIYRINRKRAAKPAV